MASLETQWRAQASQLLGAALTELPLSQAALARQGKLRTGGRSDPFLAAAYALAGLLTAGQELPGLHTPLVFRSFRPSAATAAWFLRDASQLLGKLDEAAGFCSSALEELGISGAAGSRSWPAALIQRVLDVGALATALAQLESGMVQLCLTGQPRGALVSSLVASCTRCLVTCFGVTARALEWAHSTGVFQQTFPLDHFFKLGLMMVGAVGAATSGESSLQAATRAQLDAQASSVLAGLRRCAGLLTSPEHRRAQEQLEGLMPGISARGLWQVYASLLYKLVTRKEAVFPGVWNALQADKACARALLAACAHFHTLIIARPVEEWQDRVWGQVWHDTSCSAMALAQAASDTASLDFVQCPIRRELLAVPAQLEGLLGTRPSPVLLSYQASCCSLLVCDANQHFGAWEAQKRAGQGQPYPPLESLESLAAGASGIVTVLTLSVSPGAPGGVAPGQQSFDSELPVLANALYYLAATCGDLVGEFAEEGGLYLIGPAPLAATKASEACLRLAAVLPEWLAAMQRNAAMRTVLTNMLPHPPKIPSVLVAAAQLLASGTANAILLEGRVPSPTLSAAAYNCAVSAVKVVHRWAGFPAGSPARALLERLGAWRAECTMALTNVFVLAHEACKGEQFSRGMLALTARISNAVVSLAEPSVTPAESLVQLGGSLCHLVRVIGDEHPDCTQCAMLVGALEVVAGAVARALAPEARAATDKVAAFIDKSLWNQAMVFVDRFPWMAVSLVEAGALEGLARWASQQLGRPARQRSEAAKSGIAAALASVVHVLCALGDLLAERQPPGVSEAARAAVQRKSLPQLASEWGHSTWESADLWDVQIRRRLVPLMREAAAGLKRQAAAAGGSGPLSAQEAEALQQRIVAALAEGRSCANPACGQCRGASEARERLKRCSRCGVAAFCSPACMRQAWPQHRRVCKPKE